ncbi:unnamed protein product [Rotaria magnacalcarata]|uniref:Uncharacterized protein n=4 Tax=Rotaria magnacalcarata TaxID=392030 RepID=A0A815J4A8_9BILA|nr:unnamed protein product [Rotaria magnacalcarata]CAF1374323.1 unnamed protein product [Rotaria magnacalcarata]CAF1917753.1 unnamed protein product [Rotaria magnacalcarata]CAF3749646.1 unnamed protein product [Rotaria magnacalcarata]CAF3786610.1 unnamed protein product [Rotaria magnacalcarata]
MGTITHHDESLVESNEILYQNANMIDSEPFYKNFTVIQNILQNNHDEEKQLNEFMDSMNHIYRANRVPIEASSSNKYYLNDRIDTSHQDSSQIMDDTGYNSQLASLNSSLNNDNNSSARTNTISKVDETQESSTNTPYSYIDKQYFSRWYHEKYKCSASLNQFKPINNNDDEATKKNPDEDQSNIITHASVPINFVSKEINDKPFRNQIGQIYGLDDIDTSSTASSSHSLVDEINYSAEQNRSRSILKTIDNLNSKQQITIREHYPRKEMPSLTGHRSLSTASIRTSDDDEYELLLHNHPELNKDPNPQIVKKQNSDQVTYKQNISIRYLVPPTPPPTGPLIIREIVAPHPPTPPPLVIDQQDPEPLTPSPQIFREAPPTPPPHQEAQVINKVLPQGRLSPQRVIIERNPPLPPKPQSIIIEKWLPYKPAPPREVIYERVFETPMISHFQPTRSSSSDRQRYRPADSHLTSPSRLPDSVCIDRQNRFEEIEQHKPSAFEQLAWLTQQQIEEIEQHTMEYIQAHQNWLANQQQPVNHCMQMPMQFTTPTLVVNHPPITRTIPAYPQREDIPQQLLYQPVFLYPSYK